MTGTTLALATRLRGMTPAEVTDALHARELHLSPAALAAISDHFDLADVMLDPASVQQALTRLDRHTLATLALLAREGRMPMAGISARLTSDGLPVGQEQVAALLDVTAQLLLTHPDGKHHTVYDAVATQLGSWPERGLPSYEDLVTVPVPHSSVPSPAAPSATDQGTLGTSTRTSVTTGASGASVVDIDGLASERAFTATTAVAELLVELERQPARRLAKGGIALPDTRRLAETMRVDGDAAAGLISLATEARLIAADGTLLTITRAGTEWLERSTPTRWSALAQVWLSAVDPRIRPLLQHRAPWDDHLRARVDWLFPAAGDRMLRHLDTVSRHAELLGITAGGTPSTAGTHLLDGDPAGAEQHQRDIFPREIDTVYLQHDLTVVAPGPLRPELDTRMRLVADVENRGLATTYRVTATSVNRALTAGETADTLTQFLSEISATGIPQPLAYLLTETAARHGTLRVSTLDGSTLDPDDPAHGARSQVRSDDADLIHTIAVDQSLGPLALTPVGPHRLVSRFARDIVFWTLSDTRYPVAAEDADGHIVPLRRHTLAPDSDPHGPDPLADLAARLHRDTDADPRATRTAWLSRQIEEAVAARAPLLVSIRMPDGSTSEHRLEPTGVGGGRMRARDHRNDTERTLPLSSILSIAPADD